jgi:DNA-binding NarL/FixJ family response regulator
VEAAVRTPVTTALVNDYDIVVMGIAHLLRRVAVYTWTFHPDLIDSARRQGVHGYLSKALPARELVAALEAIHAGDVVISDPPFRARSSGGLNWLDEARDSLTANRRSWR